MAESFDQLALYDLDLEESTIAPVVMHHPLPPELGSHIRHGRLAKAAADIGNYTCRNAKRLLDQKNVFGIALEGALGPI